MSSARSSSTFTSALPEVFGRTSNSADRWQRKPCTLLLCRERAGPAHPKGTFAEAPPDADAKFSTMADTYLYLGPRDLLLNEPAPADALLDKDYMAEFQRRTALIGDAFIAGETNPDKICEHDANVFFYEPNELKKFLAAPDSSGMKPLAQN
jgi:hypothetical protein